MVCSVGPQLAYAMDQIAQAGAGMVVYLRQEGRGIGLTEKIKAYHLQDQGFDTFDANVKLGHLPDNRSYDMLAEVFSHLGVTKINLMTNNPEKISSIESQGVEVVDRLPIKVGHNTYNLAYLKTKKDKFLHLDWYFCLVYQPLLYFKNLWYICVVLNNTIGYDNFVCVKK